MAPSDLENLIQSLCSVHALNPVWVKAIITQESQWNLYAIRYEVNYRYLYQPEVFSKSHLISLNTEIISQKISWGLGQIMGGLAREQGHRGLMPELLKPEININHICLRLSQLKKKSTDPDDIFAAYNGGEGAMHKEMGKYKNQAYVDSIHTHLQKFQ